MLSITDEPADLVDAFVAEFGVTHPLVILKTDELEKLIGVSGYPTSAVFSGGELAWTGHPSSSSAAVGKALKSAKKGSVFPKSLAKVRQLIRAKEPAQAHAEIVKSEPKLSAEDAAWARRVKAWIEEESVAALAAAKTDAESGYYYRAEERARGFSAAESTIPNATEVREWLAALESSVPEWKKEMAGGKAFEEAVAQEKQLLFTDAFKAYKSVMRSAKGTKIAANAETAARAILDGRKSGYQEHCENCDSKEKRACNRHWEEVKI